MRCTICASVAISTRDRGDIAHVQLCLALSDLSGTFDQCYDAVLAMDATVAGVAIVHLVLPHEGGVPEQINVDAELYTGHFFGEQWNDPHGANDWLDACVKKKE